MANKAAMLFRFGVCFRVRRFFGFSVGFRRRFHVQQLNVEDQRGVSRDARNAGFAVGQRRWDHQLDFGAFLDVLPADGPASDHAVPTERLLLAAGV